MECDVPEFYSEDFPRAAKEHRCCECSAPIETGEKHLYARGKNDGEFWAERQHMLCRELCMLMNSLDPWDDGCCPFGWMKEAFSEIDFKSNPDVSHLMALVEEREHAFPTVLHSLSSEQEQMTGLDGLSSVTRQEGE